MKQITSKVPSDLPVILTKGKILTFLADFLTYADRDSSRLWESLIRTIHVGDLVLVIAAGWFIVPAVGALYSALFPTEKAPQYRDTYCYLISFHISQAARLAVLVYALDCVAIVLHEGFNFQSLELQNVSSALAKTLYLIWIAHRLAVLKRYLLSKAVGAPSPDRLGSATFIDRIIDGMIYVATAIVLLDVLAVDIGAGVKSAFALGSVWTLVVGLASQKIATMFVSGIMLTATDNFRVGDNVRFGDGTNGIVHKIGWLQTTIRKYDNLIEVLPNSDVALQRVRNFSRVSQCQVQQNLRFRYEDADKLETVCSDIIEEIKLACPASIINGTRPFRAHWREYREDHLLVVVDVHFNVKPAGRVYWDNRQRVLQAIQKAVERNHVAFVTTFYPKAIN